MMGFFKKTDARFDLQVKYELYWANTKYIGIRHTNLEVKPLPNTIQITIRSFEDER
jgi:hypothetical protein